MSGGTGRRRSRALRLRRWLLLLGVAFLALLVALVGYTRYRMRRAVLNLPHAMGIDIKSETDGFTYSQTVKGRTLFTIHAAKAIQHTDGKTTLRNVSVILYGPPGSNRQDVIRGAEFEYDQPNGVVRAMGDTLIDVAAPGNPANAADNARRMTVQGRGLVFLQKLGVASTAETIRFEYGAMHGEATGADYELDTGILTLQHNVHLHSTEPGHSEQVDAASARLNRNTRSAMLEDATLRSAGETLRGAHMTVGLRAATDPDAGSLQAVDATGGVVMHTAAQEVQAPQMHATFSTDNHLTGVLLTGGVRVLDAGTEAAAEQGTLHFDGQRADHLLLSGRANVQQTEPTGDRRTLHADRIDAALHEANGHTLLQEVHASGSARLVLEQGAATPGRERTELTAPEMVAHSAAHTDQLQQLDASGGAHLLQTDGSGANRTSTGDRLTVVFAPADRQGGTKTGRGASSVQSVVEDGHVVLHQTQPAAPALAGRPARAASETGAHADHTEFQAGTGVLVLTGAPEVTADGLQLAAGRIALNQTTGDADATGTVRGSLLPQPTRGQAHNAGEPARFAGAAVHVSRAQGTVLLLGGDAEARLWTGSGQVEAPRIEADQKMGTLHATGNAGAAGFAVRTVLSAAPERTDAAATGAGEKQAASLTRIFSRELFYRGVPGKPAAAEFRGGVRLLEGADVLTADSATAQLHGGEMLAGAVQSITAEGHVRLVESDRTATGAHLVYTAADRRAVLTGTPGAPPVLRDAAQGTITGTAVIVHLREGTGDNQVEVTGAAKSPVHTELDLPEKSGTPAASTRARTGRKPHSTP